MVQNARSIMILKVQCRVNKGCPIIRNLSLTDHINSISLISIFILSSRLQNLHSKIPVARRTTKEDIN